MVIREWTSRVTPWASDRRAWAEQHFGGAELGDVRRVRRTVAYASAMLETPSGSIPTLGERPYDVQAIYDLLSHPLSTPDRLQAGHRAWVRGELETPGTYLLVEDRTEVDFARRQPIPGLGRIGNDSPHHQGCLLQSVLAVQWGVEPELTADRIRRPPARVIGLADQRFAVRPPKRATPAKRRYEGTLRLESELWIETTQALGPAPETAGARLVRIADRDADLYEALRAYQEQGYGFVVRAKHDRVLIEPEGTLFCQARAARSLGSYTLYSWEQRREARVQLSVTDVVIRSPQRPGHGPGALEPIRCRIVRVWEPDPPAAATPLEWLLLTDAAAPTFEDALVCVLQYCTRWLVEDFHKALKTGMKAEQLQLESAHALMAAIAVKSVVALTLVELREQLRIDPSAPAAQSGLDPVELEVLALKTRRTLSTVADVALALGRLGGHLNRKRDGMPGMITLWRGLSRLRDWTLGYKLALAHRPPSTP